MVGWVGGWKGELVGDAVVDGWGNIFVSHKRVGMEELGIKSDQDGSARININEEGQRKSNHMDGLRGDKCSAHRRTPLSRSPMKTRASLASSSPSPALSSESSV